MKIPKAVGAYNVEQMYIDRHYGKPDCVNVHNSARSAWLPGTMPEDVRDRLVAAGNEANRNRDYAKGWSHTEETKQKMSQAQLARDPSTFRRGFTVSEETRAKMQIANSRPRRKGQIFSDERKANMAAAAKNRNSKSNVAVSVAGIVYKTIAEAARAIGVTHRTVRLRLQDDRYKDYTYV